MNCTHLPHRTANRPARTAINRPSGPTTAAARCAMPLIIVLAALVLVVMTGCQANTNPEFGRLDPALPYTRIMINDDELARALVFDEPIVLRDEEGFITQVEVTVRAAAIEALKVDYRPRFKSASGTTLQPESSWRTKLMEKRVPEKIVMRPTGRNAMDYEILFRWAR
ncbi:MAG: hypothetical protein D8M59_00290 [Planctomycetes bacterium]|nr:hypothetical protein [Planctomycetota bacterium]NOG54840.1 hypothetical protein [Planctomycetota bacterium]